MQHLDEATLQAWVDRARSGIGPSAIAEIERHLTGCAGCASRVEDLAALGLRAQELLSIAPNYAPRVPYEDVARRARGSRTRARSRVRRVKSMWAASVVAAVGLGWMSNNVYRASLALEAAIPAPSPQPAPAFGAPPDASLAEVAESTTGVATAAPGASPSTADLASSTAAPAASRASGTLVASGGTTPGNDIAGLVVRGLVEDEGGRPVPSAQVYVAGLEVGALTQRNGRYDLRLPGDPESFELTVQRIGFRQQTRAISGGEGAYVDADFRLREEALALDEIIVPGESEGAQTRSIGNMVTNRRATPFVWRPAPSITAEGYVGSDLWALPGLDVLTLEVAYGDNANETHVARVRQDLGRGATLTLIQGRTDGRRTRWPVESAGAVASTWRGEMLITATAPLSPDSLRTLLAQLR